MILTPKGLDVICRHRLILEHKLVLNKQACRVGNVLFSEVFGRRLRQAGLTVQLAFPCSGCRREDTKIPSPPALDTAAAISAYPTHIIPPCTMGFDIPRAVVKTVVIVIFGSPACRGFGLGTRLKTCDRDYLMNIYTTACFTCLT